MEIRAKTATQQRSQEKRDRILAAMETLLKIKSFGKITIADISQTADVSPATIYQRFNNHDAAASILLELYYQRIEDWALSAAERDEHTEKPPLFDALFVLAQNAWDQVCAIQHVMRPAYLVSRLKPEIVGETWELLEERSLKGFQHFLAQYSSEIAFQDVDKAAGVLSYFFNFMTAGKLLHPENTSWTLIQSRDEFSRELATMAYGYLASSKAEKS